MEAFALRKEAIGLIERMSEDNIPVIIKFARFMEQDDSDDFIKSLSLKGHKVPSDVSSMENDDAFFNAVGRIMLDADDVAKFREESMI